MAVKETPTGFRVYYKSMKDTYTQKRLDAIEKLSEIKEKERVQYILVDETFKNNPDAYSCDLTKYEEFNENKYKNGTFLKVAKNIFANRHNNFKLVTNYFDLFKLAKLQKDIVDIQNLILLCDKMLDLSVMEYLNILKKYYTEVQRKMILEGQGYAFSGNIGWICINRCKINKSKKKIIDFKATKANKEKLLAEGKRIYKKEEAEWCKQNNIEYNGVDARVFVKNEYAYEIPLLRCTLPHGSNMKFVTSDYRSPNLRGKTNEDLKEECNNDINKICDLDLDIRTKLNMCVSVNKMLYTKFIRNENQESSVSKKVNRKD